MKRSHLFLSKRSSSCFCTVTLFVLFTGFLTTEAFAQNQVLDVGLRLQKSVNLYYENGVTVQYTTENLMSNRLYFGFSYVTSRLGSAISSNAIKQDNFILSSTYYLRPAKMLQPFVRLNTGYFYADYEEAVFDDLPNSSLLLSPEAGLGFKTNSPLKIGASLGYNLITGDGVKGPGTLYPLYLQTSITWNMFNTTLNEK